MQVVKMFLIIFSCVFLGWLQDVGAECPMIVSKKEWDGVKAKHIQFLTTPVDLVIIQHTVTQSCSNEQSCADVVRDIQKTHMSTAFLWDIGPSFLIANTGKIYEGRGWKHVAVHTYGYNNQSIGIAFIGNFNNQEPSASAMEAARSLINCGVEEEQVSANHHVIIHNQLLPTESPGRKLARKIMSWPDWKEDVTEIKKRADKQEVVYLPNVQENQEESLQSREAVDLEPVVKSRPKREILTTPKEIDLLSNARDIISELIDNIRNLAQQILNTVEALARGLNRQVALFLEKLSSRLRTYRDRVHSAIGGISFIPGINRCTKRIKEKADVVYNNSEAKVKACSDQRVSEIDNLIKNLGTLSNNAINFSNTAVEQTKNCTEMNYGIAPSTRDCLNSVTSQTRSATETFNSQRTLALNTIQSALDALPAALDLCAKKPLLDAGSETTNVISEISDCGIFL